MSGELIWSAAACFFACFGFVCMLNEIIFLLFRPKYKRAVLIVEGEQKSTFESIANDAGKKLDTMQISEGGQVVILLADKDNEDTKNLEYYENVICAKEDELIDILREKLR